MAAASLRDMPRCTVSDSVICLPIFMTGLSDVMGSWKIMAISRPQILRRSRSDMVVSSTPSNCTVPPRSTLRLGRRPMIERDRMVLPEPDSPTTPSVLPRSRVRLTPSTARTVPSGVMKCVLRSRTSSRVPVTGRFKAWKWSLIRRCPGC